MDEILHVAPRTRVRLTLGLLIFAAGVSASAGTSAQEYRLRQVGGWTVAASQDGKGCFLTKVYEHPGETTLLLGLEIDRSNRLSVLNANWSIKEKSKQRLDFRLSNASFPEHLAIGIASDEKRGFVAGFGEAFPASFAASAFLHIFRGDVPVEKLELRGSGVAVAELRRCVEHYRRMPPAAARGSDRERDIPIDPFAPDEGRKPKK